MFLSRLPRQLALLLAIGFPTLQALAADQVSSQLAALKGSAFLEQWADRNSTALLRHNQSRMPPGSADTLSEIQHLAIVAFLLQNNGIEVFNSTCRFMARGESAVHWDDWMSFEDRVYPCLANDDTHALAQALTELSIENHNLVVISGIVLTSCEGVTVSSPRIKGKIVGIFCSLSVTV